MIAGEALTAHYRFYYRAERGMRAAKQIEQDIRRRERAERERAAYVISLKGDDSRR